MAARVISFGDVVTVARSIYICTLHFTQKLRAALQVFTDHATLSDYHVRASLLAELATLCSNNTLNSNIAGEVMASSSRLDMYSQRHSQLTLQRGHAVFGRPPIRCSAMFNICLID